jgi:hypothetical protein
MSPEAKPNSGKTLLTLVILLLILASSFVYYGSTLNKPVSATSNSEITSLKSTISSLENTNHALQAQLSAPISNSSSSTVLSAQLIYAASARSVVTVQGDQQTTVNTIYGPQSSVTAVMEG